MSTGNMLVKYLRDAELALKMADAYAKKLDLRTDMYLELATLRDGVDRQLKHMGETPTSSEVPA